MLEGMGCAAGRPAQGVTVVVVMSAYVARYVVSVRAFTYSPRVARSLLGLDRLYSLEMDRNALSGTLPPEFKELTSLGFVELFDTYISGTIPRQIGALGSLFNLEFTKMPISGTIPENTYYLNSLKNLELTRTGISGTIAIDIGRLTDLKQVVARPRVTVVRLTPSTCHRAHTVHVSSSSHHPRVIKFTPPTCDCCAPHTVHVSQLRLDDTLLSGTLPEEITMLLELSELDVASSYFFGRRDLRAISRNLAPSLAISRHLAPSHAVSLARSRIISAHLGSSRLISRDLARSRLIHSNWRHRADFVPTEYPSRTDYLRSAY